ncbi:hypothetical protein FQA47_018430 [Oryzias melastigma]|uniref:Uncharacterized protein n=1 Tax=Oryzias melastigma TaxID=30732 RepID=A0A834FF45_ORYME|nr:hypothetical protein FQA47_018430 [Oryzias melastigma]
MTARWGNYPKPSPQLNARKLRDRRISGHLQLQQRRSRKDGDHPLDRPGARMRYEDNFREDRSRRRLKQGALTCFVLKVSKPGREVKEVFVLRCVCACMCSAVPLATL